MSSNFAETHCDDSYSGPNRVKWLIFNCFDKTRKPAAAQTILQEHYGSEWYSSFINWCNYYLNIPR